MTTFHFELHMTQL